jgi:uncharacterized membrane protein YgcG
MLRKELSAMKMKKQLNFKNYNQRNKNIRPPFILAVAIITITLLISGTTTTTLLFPRTYAQATTPGADTGTAVGGSNIVLPKLSLDYGTNGKKFEPINERYMVQSGNLVNNDNFKFFRDVWDEVTRGDIVGAQYGNNNILDTIVKFVKVLNPIPNGAQEYKNMKFGTTIITPPHSSDDNGQHRNFLITNDVPGGYYLVNVFGKFGGTQNFGVVYTGKMLIANASGPSGLDNQRSVTRVIVRDGSYNCHPGQVYDPTTGDCIGNITPRTGPHTDCTAIQHLDPTYHVCVPLGRPWPPLGSPYPPVEPGEDNCAAGFNFHVGACVPPGGGCPPGTHRASARPIAEIFCEFNVIPPLGPDGLHYRNISPQQCQIDPMTGACISNSPAPTTPTAPSSPPPAASSGGHHRGGSPSDGVSPPIDGGGGGGGGTPDGGSGGGGPPIDNGGGGGCKGDKCGGGGGGTPSDGGGGSGDISPGGK